MSIFRTAQVISFSALLASMSLFCQAPTSSFASSRPAAVATASSWVSPDGHVRQTLLPDHRYEEMRDGHVVYRGRYRLSGQHIEYWDDAGFTADGDFVNGVLHQGGTAFIPAPSNIKPRVLGQTQNWL